MYNGKEIKTRSTAKVNQTAFGKDKVVKPHIPVDPAGYWNPANWGKPVTIPSSTITGRGINQPLIGVDNLGTVKPILPGQPLIQFPGNRVTEYPILKNGGISCPPGYIMYKGQCVKWEEPKVENTTKNTGYEGLTGTIKRNIMDPNQQQDWWMEHEKFHHLQNLANGLSSSGVMGQRPNPLVASDQSLAAYYDVRPSQVDAQINAMIEKNPELQFIPREKLRFSTPGFVGADSLIYSNPNTIEGEARVYENQFRNNNQSMFPMKKNGGSSKNYFDVMLSDDEILQYKNGGFVVQDLPKAQDGGGQYFAYEGRPDSYYRKVNGQWQILNSSTNGKFIDLKDPKGERKKLLDAQAYPIGDEASKKLDDWGMQVRANNAKTVNVTVPKLNEIRGGVTAAPTQNIFANPQFMTSQQLQQKANNMAPTVEGTKWLQMAAAQKKNEESKKEFEQKEALRKQNQIQDALAKNYVAPTMQNFTESTFVPETLPYVMAGTDEKGNATLVTKAQAEEVDREVEKDMAFMQLQRDRKEMEQVLGRKLTDEEYYDAEGNYNKDYMLGTYYNQDFLNKIEDQKYQNFLDANQKAYDSLAWYDKGLSTLNNLIDDPVITLGNWMEGKGTLYGQAQMLRSDNPLINQYARRASNADDYWLNDYVNMVNPAAWGADIGADIMQGNYGSAALGALSVLPVFKAFGVADDAVRAVTKSPLGKTVTGALHTGMETPLLRTAFKPSTVNNALLQSSESALTKGLLDLTPSSLLANYSRVAAPGAIYNYMQNPTAGGFVDAALLTAGVPEVWQGAGALAEGSKYIKPYAQTIKNIATGEAPLSRESFKRQDLFRFDTAPKLSQYADDYAAAMRGEKELSATRGRYASTVENPDAMMYATTATEPTYYYRFPATKGSAKSYNIAQQYGNMEGKLASNAGLTSYEKGIRLAGERSVLPSAQFEEDLASGMYANLNLSDETIANIRKVTQNPDSYWNQPWYTGNTELQQIMTNPQFINRSEYLLPYHPNPNSFQLASNVGDVTNSMGSSLATSMRAAAGDKFAAERAVASQEGKIVTGKGVNATDSEENDATTLTNPWAAAPQNTLSNIIGYKPSQEFLNLTGRTFQEGGSSNSPVYEGELTNDKIKELERQGFKIEFVDQQPPVNLNLPHRGEVFKKNRLMPHAFVDAFSEGDVNNLLLGVGVSGMFDTPLKQLSAGFDLNMINVAGFGNQGMLYNDLSIAPPSLRLNYNIPYTPKKNR